MRSLKRNRKAVSPVISTIILVAIAIIMSITVAYWMQGLGAIFMRFERIEIHYAYSAESEENSIVYMGIRNGGTSSVTIESEDILYNGKPNIAYITPIIVDLDRNLAGNNSVITLEAGDRFDIQIFLSNAEWSSGMSVEITISSVTGTNFQRVINLS